MDDERYITEKGFESAMAREDRKNKRLWILVIILLVMLFSSNAGWIWYESQFEDVVTTTQTVTQDTGSEGGTNTFTGDFYGGDYNGEANSK